MQPSCLIIGGGPGMGLGLARRFAQGGYPVGLITRRQTTIDQMAKTLGGEGYLLSASLSPVTSTILPNNPMAGKLKPIIIIALTFGCYYLSLGQSVEVFAGNDNTQGDIQWLKEFRSGSRFLFFNRNRFTVDYENKTTYFISGITAYELKSGVGIANEINISTAGMMPKMGFQFLSASSTRTIYAFVNAGYLNELLYGLFCFARFEPMLSTNVRLYMQLEIVNSSSATGNQFLAQRPRLGIIIKQTQFGLAGDFKHSGEDFQFASNLGIFARKVF